LIVVEVHLSTPLAVELGCRQAPTQLDRILVVSVAEWNFAGEAIHSTLVTNRADLVDLIGLSVALNFYAG
jgi:hypothetical protein